MSSGGEMSKKATNEELLENLREVVIELGRAPKIKEMVLNDINKYSINAYKRAFGSLGSALREIGIEKSTSVPKEEIISSLTKLYQEMQTTPTLEQYFKEYPDHRYYEISGYFGSWTKALLCANIPIEKANKVSQQDVIDALEIWYKKNNCQTSCLEYWKVRKARDSREFPYTCNTIKAKFEWASWEDIMQKIDPKYITRDPYISRGRFLGKDGCEYLSAIERDVSNILCDLKAKRKIKTYEYEKLVCLEKTWTCDFVIDDTLWLEVDGMRGNRKDPYDSGRNEKIEYYKNNNMNYRIISYTDTNIRKKIFKFIGDNNGKVKDTQP